MSKLLIFDLDGTLLNTSYDLCDVMNDFLTKHGYKVITYDETLKFVGYGARKFLEFSLKGQGQDNFDSLYTEFAEMLSIYGNPKTEMYDGLKEVLKELKKRGYKFAVMSNKPQKALDEVCRQKLNGIKFEYVLGERDGIKIKPDKTALLNMLQELGVNREDAILIGDSEVDYQTAKNCKIDFINVLWGYRTKKQLKSNGSNCFADTPKELLLKIEQKEIIKMGKKKTKGFFKDFKEFISRGNVLDLAVATIIGSAFGAIVSSFTNGIIMPLISLLFKAENLDKLVVTLKEATLDAEAVTWQYGTFVQAIINFLIIALFLFILIRIITNTKKALDIDNNMRANIQAKLDSDQELTEAEQRWMARQEKKNPDNVPHKTVQEAPKAPELSTTEKLLTDILAQLKKD